MLYSLLSFLPCLCALEKGPALPMILESLSFRTEVCSGVWDSNRGVIATLEDGGLITVQSLLGKKDKSCFAPFGANLDCMRCLALSPDCRVIAVGETSGSISLIDSRSGGLRGVLKGHASAVFCMRFSNDGIHLVSSSQDSTIRVWNLFSLNEIAVLRGHQHFVCAISITSDGKTVLSGSHDKTVKAWNLLDGKEIRTFHGHNKSVISVAVSADGNDLLSGGQDGSIRVWDLRSGKQRFAVSGLRYMPYDLDCSPSGNVFVSAGSDGTARVYDLKSGRELFAFCHGFNVRSVAFAADGKSIMSCGSNGNGNAGLVKIWTCPIK